MATFSIDPQCWSAFLRGIARGRYYLLLGAGASVGGRDALGGDLPLGGKLAEELMAQFDLPATAASLPLPRVYEAARRRPGGRHYPNVDAYLHDRFSGCAAPQWMYALPSIQWRRLWTLNIDDTLDDAYLSAPVRLQELRPAHWSQPFFEEESIERVAAIHLHGRARTLTPEDPQNLVFSLEQYLEAALAGHAWHRVFGDLFRAQPFVVIGARLVDELDLATVLRRRNSSSAIHGLPSLAVLNSIDELQREELEAWGLVPVEATGDEFMAAVTADVPEYRRKASPLTTTKGHVPPAALRFLAQFRALEVEEEPERDPRHDLYAGHDPTWQDIVRNRDARFPISQRLALAADEALRGQRSERVFCLHGRRFTGKTTTLYRAARELVSLGRDVFLFVGDERPSLPAVKWWLEHSGTTVLVFDGIADFTPDIGELVSWAEATKAGVVVLASEREGRMKRIVTTLPEQRLAIGEDLRLDRLSDPDINALLSKLREEGRLGRISRRDKGGQLAYFRREHDRSLFSAMAGLESGTGFSKRLRAEYELLKDHALERAYGACCLVHSLGYPTPLALLATSAGLAVRDLLAAARDDDAFGELVKIEGDKVKTRQRALASLVTQEVLSAEQRFDLSSALATNLAAYLSPRTIAQRTIYARIAAELMDQEILRDWVGPGRVENWYSTQVGTHGWNARFWEQRALAASHRGAWDKAESYAEKAVGIHADPFTLNTLGVILARKGMEWAAGGDQLRYEYYARAVRALEESRTRGHDKYMHPYITFFTYTLRFAREEQAAGRMIERKIRTAWDDWMFKARAAEAFLNQDLRKQLDDLQRSWLLLAVPGELAPPRDP